MRLLHIHKKLCENQPFENLSILMVGDLLQLPPIKVPQIFEPYNNGLGDFFSWSSFSVMAELTEVMWQKGDKYFVNIPNNIRIEDNANQIQMRKILIGNVHSDVTL